MLKMNVYKQDFILTNRPVRSLCQKTAHFLQSQILQPIFEKIKNIRVIEQNRGIMTNEIVLSSVTESTHSPVLSAILASSRSPGEGYVTVNTTTKQMCNAQ